MKPFLKKYWLETAMLVPLFAYITGFTVLPVLGNLIGSLEDQQWARKRDRIEARINDITYDMRTDPVSAADTELERELQAAEADLENLQRAEEAGATLANYRHLLSDTTFRSAVMNTVSITLTGLVLQCAAAMAIALMLSQAFRGKGMFRTIVLTPLGLPTIVSATIMTYIFDTSGYLNALLYKVGLIDTVGIDWARGGWNSIGMIVFADTWKVLPVLVLLFMAGLESIPRSVREAAAIDGAEGARRFFSITLPLMKPYITVALVLRGIDSFRIFELPLVLAGFSATPVISTCAYNDYVHQNYSLSAAAGTVLTAIILVFVLGYLFLAEREKQVKT